MKTKNLIISIFVVLFLLLFLIFFFKDQTFYQTKSIASKILPEKMKAIIKIAIYDKKNTLKFKNDYNEKFLPNTQFVKTKFKKKKINFLKASDLSDYSKGSKSFYLEIVVENKILLTDSNGNFYLINDLNNESFNLKNTKKINTNIEAHKILDTYLFKKRLFVSFIENKNNCKNFIISYANFNSDFLNFEEFFRDNKCGRSIQAGRMQYLNFNNSDGLIFSMADNVSDKPNDEPQNNDSNYGKMIFKSFAGDKEIIFSKGHRNPQGLFVDENLILSTEHGPRGGDEINKIEYGNNYGWPISSYGFKYSSKQGYLQNHKENGFKEPIFAFVPSIGISEIIKIPNNFVKVWKNNFIIASLYRSSLYRVKFNDNFDKLIYLEEIFVGQRIRDIKYLNKKFYLALESEGELGVISFDE